MEARAVRRLHVIGVTLFAALMAILAGGGAWVGHYLLADRDRIFLAALAQTTEEARRATELRLARTVEDLLERSVGPGRVRAEAAVDFDYD